MTCSSCSNIQCYVCSKSCDYSHFNDTRRGGKTGNCELFDEAEGGIDARHQREVNAAEEAARKKIQEEFKDLNPEYLNFKESEKVKEDQAKRRKSAGCPLETNDIFADDYTEARGPRFGHMARLNVGDMGRRERIRDRLREAAVREAAGHMPPPFGAQFLEPLPQFGGAPRDPPIDGPVPQPMLEANLLLEEAVRREERLFDNMNMHGRNDEDRRIAEQRVHDRDRIVANQNAQNAAAGRVQDLADFNRAVIEQQLQMEEDRLRVGRQRQEQIRQQQREQMQRHQRELDQRLRQRQELGLEHEPFAARFQREMNNRLKTIRGPGDIAALPGLDYPAPAPQPDGHPAIANRRGVQVEGLFGELVEAAGNQEYAIHRAAIPDLPPGNLPGAIHEPGRPATPSLDQRRGGRGDPISLVSPAGKADMIDLTVDDNDEVNRRFEDALAWQDVQDAMAWDGLHD